MDLLAAADADCGLVKEGRISGYIVPLPKNLDRAQQLPKPAMNRNFPQPVFKEI
jgi:hypothetical protein